MGQSAGRTGGCCSQPFCGGHVAHVVARDLFLFFFGCCFLLHHHHHFDSMHSPGKGRTRAAVGDRWAVIGPCAQYSVTCPTLALPTPLSASAQPSLSLFQPLPSMCAHASLHASHCFSAVSILGMEMEELGLGQPNISANQGLFLGLVPCIFPTDSQISSHHNPPTHC